MCSRLLFFTLVAVLAVTGYAQAPDEPLQRLDLFLGTWTGSSRGQPGDGTLDREFRRVLRGRFIEIRNKSVYPPQPRNQKGETHEDWGMISYDRSRKKLVLRQFHIEGFVNQYTADAPAAGGREIVFASEAIENIPAGWRARETWRILNPNEFEEAFELAAPGKDFEVYSRSRLKRR